MSLTNSELKISSVILDKNRCCLLVDKNNENVFFFITKC